MGYTGCKVCFFVLEEGCGENFFEKKVAKFRDLLKYYYLCVHQSIQKDKDEPYCFYILLLFILLLF